MKAISAWINIWLKNVLFERWWYEHLYEQENESNLLILIQNYFFLNQID
jgi:hypothetical protein